MVWQNWCTVVLKTMRYDWFPHGPESGLFNWSCCMKAPSKEIQSSTCSSTGYFQRFHHDGVLSFEDYEQLSSCTLRKHDLFVEVGSMDHCIQRIILFVLEHYTCFISTSHMFIYSFSQFWFTHDYRASSRARSLISPNAKKIVAKNNVPCAMRQGNVRNGWQIWSRWW